MQDDLNPFTNPISNSLIDDLCKNPAILAAIARKLKLSDPEKTTRSPYYCIENANAVLPFVTEMLNDQNKCDIHLMFEEYNGLNPKTIRQKLYGGIRFLVDKMDDTGKYKEWDKSKIIEEKADRFVIAYAKNKNVIVFNKFRRVDASTVKEVTINTDIKQSVMSFLDSSTEGTKFAQDNLNLNDNEIDWLENLSFGVKDIFTFSISKTSIRILHGKIPEME